MPVKYEPDGPRLNPETGWWRWAIWDTDLNKVVESGSSPSVEECITDIKEKLSNLPVNGSDIDFLENYDNLVK